MITTHPQNIPEDGVQALHSMNTEMSLNRSGCDGFCEFRTGGGNGWIRLYFSEVVVGMISNLTLLQIFLLLWSTIYTK